MVHTIEPVYRMYWSDAEGTYESTGELIGYQCVGADGRVLGYGEDPESALQAGYEAVWSLEKGGEDMPPSSPVVTAR